MKEMQSLLRPYPRHRVTLWCTLIPFVAGASFMALRALELNERMRSMANARGHLEQTESRTVFKPFDQETAIQWNILKGDIAFPWAGFLDSVEDASSPHIELLEMTPDKQARAMVLRGEARDSNALLAYLSRLRQQPRLQEVVLSRRVLVQREGLTTIEFEIRAVVR